MNQQDMIRFAIVGVILYFVLSGNPGGGSPSAPYTGSLSSLHQASRSMEPKDRAAMAEGFAAGADMVDADSKGLLKTTETAQTMLIGLLSFNYNGLAKPSQKYPSVSSEVEKVFRDTLGDEIKQLSSSDRAKLASALRDMSKALR